MVEHRDAELRRQSSEGVVGDFGFGTGDGFEEGRFAGVWESDEADFGDDFEFQDELFGFAWLAWACGSWCLVDGVFEVFVSVAAFAAFGDDEGVVWSEVDDDFAGGFIVDDGACWDADDSIVGVCSGALFGASHIAWFGFPFVDASEVDEGVESFVDGEDDVAAFSAVAAVGSAFGHTFGSFEGDFAISAVAGGDLYSCAINKHGEEGYGGFGDKARFAAEVWAIIERIWVEMRDENQAVGYGGR